MLRVRLPFIVFCFILAAFPAVAGEARYVTDRLVVGVRQSTAEGAAQVAAVASGDRVEVLGEQGRFLRVRLGDGREGYVPSQYFTVEPPTAAKVAGLEAELASLREQLASARQAPAAGADADAQQAALAAARVELEALRSQLAQQKPDPAAALQLVKERDQFRDEAARLEAELAALREESAARYATGMIPWFLAGGGVLLAGWLAGKASRSKRRY